MAITKKDKPNKKAVSAELTFLEVRQAARDGQKAFDKFAANCLQFSGETNDSI